MTPTTPSRSKKKNVKSAVTAAETKSLPRKKREETPKGSKRRRDSAGIAGGDAEGLGGTKKLKLSKTPIGQNVTETRIKEEIPSKQKRTKTLKESDVVNRKRPSTAKGSKE